MISKLLAQFIIIKFIVLSFVGLILKYFLDFDFDLVTYFKYIILLAFLTMILGKPVILIALDLIKAPYRKNEDHFPIPGRDLPKENLNPEENS